MKPAQYHPPKQRKRIKPKSPKALLAAKMRAEGKRYDEIAAACGYKHRSGACEAVRRVLVYDDLRMIDDARETATGRLGVAITFCLEELVKKTRGKSGFMRKIMAARELVKYEARLASMLGYNAPKLTANVGPKPIEAMDFEEVAAELRRFNLPVPPGIEDEIERRRRIRLGAGPEPSQNPPPAGGPGTPLPHPPLPAQPAQP